jgi:PAS domain S-box-containing protein
MCVANEPCDEHQREHQLSALLEASPDATLVVDSHGRIVSVNAQAERIFGFERDTMLGLSVEELLPQALRDAHRAHRAAFGLSPHIRSMAAGLKLVGRRRDGSEFPVEVSLNPIATEPDRFWVVAAVRDVSDRLRREQLEREDQRAVDADRLKTMFLANMSHELRTPLNAIVGFAQLLYDQQVGPLTTQQRDFLGDILSGAQHLLDLINGMLDVARIEAGRMSFAPSTFAVRELMEEVRDSVRLLAAKKDLRMTLEVEQPLELVTVDALKLKQVLLNFVGNAIKFTPEGGRISLRARCQGSDAFRLEVEDTGPGIPTDQIDKLFVEFQQLESGLVRGQEGTGLGLALCKRIVEAQGGSVGVSSMPGHGSVFYAVLPLRAAEATG